MKLLKILCFCCFFTSTNAQSNYQLSTQAGSESRELQSLLMFEDIGIETVKLKGEDLKGKNYILAIKEFKDGNLFKTHQVFNSTESDYFKIKSDSLGFKVMTKTTLDHQFKISFQFNGFSINKSYPVAEKSNDFALKDFLGAKSSLDMNHNIPANIFIYMTPFRKPDGSGQYCEVAQSGTDPSQIGKKYNIPHYFLIEMKVID